jgi:hypothetical protein
MSSGGPVQTDWLSIATDPTDGNAISYLITDDALLERVRNGATLWLDTRPFGSQDEQFIQGETGLAFLHGSKISTFINSDGKNYLAVSAPYNPQESSLALNAGRVAILDYDQLLSYVAKNPSSDLPLIDAFALIASQAVPGFTLSGTQAQDLFGTSSIVLTKSGAQQLLTGRPGQIDSDALEQLSQTDETRLEIVNQLIEELTKEKEHLESVCQLSTQDT